MEIDRFVRQGDTWLFFFRFDGVQRGELAQLQGAEAIDEDLRARLIRDLLSFWVSEAAGAASPPLFPSAGFAPSFFSFPLLFFPGRFIMKNGISLDPLSLRLTAIYSFERLG